MNDKYLCIFHANCSDGFGAAWAVRHALGDDNVEFYEGHYNAETLPDVKGRRVIMVDFSYPAAVLRVMAQHAHGILVLDHHKSAKEDLAEFYQLPTDWDSERLIPNAPAVAVLFDMERSGAGIAWDFFHPGQSRPEVINRIEDRDLWRFKYSDTRFVQAAIFSYPYDFDVWDKLILQPEMLSILYTEGQAIDRKHLKDVAELISVTRQHWTILGHDVPVACLPYTMASDAGNIMAVGQPFAATYYDTADARVFSLRSAPDGLDVSKLAASFGGGGHEHAAGFKVPRDHILARR